MTQITYRAELVQPPGLSYHPGELWHNAQKWIDVGGAVKNKKGALTTRVATDGNKVYVEFDMEPRGEPQQLPDVTIEPFRFGIGTLGIASVQEFS